MKVEYPEVGAGLLLGQLIEQNISNRMDVAEKLKGKKVVIEFTDQNVAATVEFGDDKIVIENRKAENHSAYIGTDFDTMTKLSSGQVGILGTLWLMITGKLKIKNTGVVKEFQKLLG